MKKKKQWYEYLWIMSLAYLILGFFNILFAWLGLICFATPLMISIIKKDKSYCNKYCGRGQLLALIGKKVSLKKKVPNFLKTKWFRYVFLAFFMTMFGIMIFNTYLVFSGTSNLKEAIKLLWSFNVPWSFAYNTEVTPWIAQFAFGFYSVMMTSTILGLITMILFRPRTWCVYCPMGTMTQGICQLRNGKSIKNGRESKTNS